MIIYESERFPSTQLYFNRFFTNLFNIAATCFGRTTIFKRKYIQRKLIRLTTDNESDVSRINFRYKYFRQKMVVPPIHVAAILNKLVKTNEIKLRRPKTFTPISYTQQDANTQD
jgi:hypothetical protein